ncbi:MAG: undecaprenyl-phosphate glucose phosphotransferase [Xanthobacteraceae bacterium]
MPLADLPPVEAPPLAAAQPSPIHQLSATARAIAAEPVADAISPAVLTGIVRFVEFLLILLVGTIVYAVWVYPVEGIAKIYLVAEPAIACAAIIAFQAFGIYSVEALRTHVYQLGRMGAAWGLVFLLALALTFFAKQQHFLSRVWIGAWFAGGLGALFAWRIVLAALVRHWADAGRLIRRVVIVGGGERSEALVKAIQTEAHSDLRICGVFDDRADDRSPPVVAGVPKLGTVDDLVEFTRQTRVDLILVSLPLTAEERVLQMVRKLWVLPVDVRLAAHMNRLRFRPRNYTYIGNVPVLDIFDKPIAGWNLFIKSVFDRVVGGLILLMLLPLFAIIALAIKIDSKGPVLFRQRRYGFNNELIEIFKFRSMYVDASDANAAKLVTKGDPRVTRVGRLIRKTSLDELPQLFNVVFFGNLSLVGPRPHALQAKAEHRLYEEAVDGYFARHRVKPGITGWAQINGWRGETDTHDKIQNRVEHDLYYIENWSLLFDIYILLKTPFALLKTENAY